MKICGAELRAIKISAVKSRDSKIRAIKVYLTKLRPDEIRPTKIGKIEPDAS